MGRPDLGDFDALRRWNRPRWIPDRLDFAAAAALSQLRPPKEWSHVVFIPAEPDEPWTMKVFYVRGYPDTIQIPGGGGVGTPARDVLDLVNHPEWFDDADGWDGPVDNDVEGSA